jgi:cbb3-type cytochrome oxidase subunit 3
VELLLAQSTINTESSSFATTMVALVGMLVFWVLLGYVCWIFWKAKKREDAESSGREDAWNAPSS